MTRVRLLNSKSKKGNTTLEWARLFREAVARAEKLGDPRAKRLKAGSQNPVDTLKKMSILSNTDLEREFPLPPE
jgi:hypothetical protein